MTSIDFSAEAAPPPDDLGLVDLVRERDVLRRQVEQLRGELLRAQERTAQVEFQLGRARQERLAALQQARDVETALKATRTWRAGSTVASLSSPTRAARMVRREARRLLTRSGIRRRAADARRGIGRAARKARIR